jgi:transposase
MLPRRSNMALPTARGRIRRTAIVALARKLLVALWKYVMQDQIPEGAALKT